MRRLFVYVIAMFVISGCAAKVITSNARTVVVESHGMNTAESQILADKECAKYQRYARVVARPTFDLREYVFDCVQ